MKVDHIRGLISDWKSGALSERGLMEVLDAFVGCGGMNVMTPTQLVDHGFSVEEHALFWALHSLQNERVTIWNVMLTMTPLIKMPPAGSDAISQVSKSMRRMLRRNEKMHPNSPPKGGRRSAVACYKF